MDGTRTNRKKPAARAAGTGGDPALTALMELLESERDKAMLEEPALVARCDPGRVWFLWFAIGATDEICRLIRRVDESERNDLFRQVVSLIFSGGVRSGTDPVLADRSLVELFESAGADAVQACLEEEPHLGFYVDALRKVTRRYN
jgi:hypothetical protein